MRFPTALVCIALTAAPFACSSGGGGTAGLQVSDLQGSWQVTLTTTELTGSACDPSASVGRVTTDSITISVTGNVVTIVPVNGSPIALTLRGARVQGMQTEANGNETNTAVIDFGITNGRIEGTSVSTRTRMVGTNTETLCRETQRVQGMRQAAPTTSDFNGTWTVTDTLTGVQGSNCTSTVGQVNMVEVQIVVNGTTATISAAGENPFVLTASGTRLSGSTSESANGATKDRTFQLDLTSRDTFTGNATTTRSEAGVQQCTETSTFAATRVGS